MNISSRFNAKTLGCTLVLATMCCTLIAHAQPPDAPKEAGEEWPVVSIAEVLAKLGGPTLVTLKFEQTPLEEVLKELSKVHENYRFVAVGDAKQLVTVNIEKKPFWRAVRELALRHPIRVESRSGFYGRTPNLSHRATPMWETDGFVFLVNYLTRSKSQIVRFDGNAAVGNNDSLQVECQVLVDPKLQPQFSRGAETVLAQDDMGRNLNPQRQFSWGFHELTLNSLFHIQLTAPSRDARRLTILQGTLRVLQERETQVWEVTDLENLSNLKKTLVIDGVTSTYTLESFTLNNGYQLRLKGEAAPLTEAEKLNTPVRRNLPFGARRSRLVQPRITLLDQNRQLFGASGFSGNSGGDKFSFTQTFSHSRTPRRLNDPNAPAEPEGDVPVPTTLRLEFPTSVAMLKIPFEFTDLPLPQFEN